MPSYTIKNKTGKRKGCAMSRNGITIFLAVVWSLLSVSLAADDISFRLDKIMELEKSGNTKEMAAAARETLDMMKPDDVRAGFVWYRLCCGIAESNAADRYDELYDMYAEGKFRSNPAFFISVQMENMPQYGYMIDGKFVRGNNRGGGRYANCVQRDRVRLLARMSELIPEAEKEKWDVPVFLWNPPKE